MVEVFKTNVREHHHAKLLVHHIHENFGEYKANFDLDDCDNILRVKSSTGQVEATVLIDLLKELGFDAEVLPDE
jgi:hypothetical protein